MNILLISQCSKKALKETRRILDQFSERCGDRTWETAITFQGIETIKRNLKKSARKNTAVACHWIKKNGQRELIWIVGDKSQFNYDGTTPTNQKRSTILEKYQENSWVHLQLIRLLVDIAGLLHDLGKSTDKFQEKLFNKEQDRNIIRHEWVSLRLFEAFVGDDDDLNWLKRLSDYNNLKDEKWINDLRCDYPEKHHLSPISRMSKAPLAQAIGWLVLTHHRLPELPLKGDFQMSLFKDIWAYLTPSWNEKAFQERQLIFCDSNWKFSKELPVCSYDWKIRASRVANRLIEWKQRNFEFFPLNNPYVMHISRLCLMLADHKYSSLKGHNNPLRYKVKSNNGLIANTSSDGKPNQGLDEHLIGVSILGTKLVCFLPNYDKNLPRLQEHTSLKLRTAKEKYRWQNNAFDLAESIRLISKKHGSFIVNMASTGCGKTIGNARFMYGLNEPREGLRCTFALGLRTLTLQTGLEFQRSLDLSPDELAIRVGGSANKILFEHFEKEAEASGSASIQSLFEEHTGAEIIFEGRWHENLLLKNAIKSGKANDFIVAPILVCTIDHLIPATDSQRGGHQILPMLRLMSSDLVIDEPDDFDLSDLPALTRLVNWAGMLGARVLLSSATLTPSIVEGLFEAYQAGRSYYQTNQTSTIMENNSNSICCVWIDEFHQTYKNCQSVDEYKKEHLSFSSLRSSVLDRLRATPKRIGSLIQWPKFPKTLSELAEVFAAEVAHTAQQLHNHHHCVDPITGKEVSFGLVRIANIRQLYQVGLHFFNQNIPSDTCFHVCVYHSRFPLLVRANIEKELDITLKRHDPMKIFKIDSIRTKLDTSKENKHIFIVLGSPVTEVGRDHDYDWAVIEPSSMRSIIQIAGRVRRHRNEPVIHPNIIIFRSNFKYLLNQKGPCFINPGFESKDEEFVLNSHDLSNLLLPEEYQIIDSQPRILERTPDELKPQERLVDLEHFRIRTLFHGKPADKKIENISTRSRRTNLQENSQLSISTWWKENPEKVQLSGLLQQLQPFRKNQEQPTCDLYLIPNEDCSEWKLHKFIEEKKGRFSEGTFSKIEHSKLIRLDDSFQSCANVRVWINNDYCQSLIQIAKELDKPILTCAKTFGVVTVPQNEMGWRYNDFLGFDENRSI